MAAAQSNLEIKEFRCYEAARCATEAFSTTCAVHIHVENCEGWWLSGSVAEHWQFKPEVSWVRLAVIAGLFSIFAFAS